MPSSWRASNAIWDLTASIRSCASRDLSLLFGDRILCRLDCRLGIGVRSFRICLNCQRVRASLSAGPCAATASATAASARLSALFASGSLAAAASAASSAAWTAPEAAASCCLAASKSDLASAGAIAEIIEWAVGTDALLTMAAGPASVATVMLPAQKKNRCLARESIGEQARATHLWDGLGASAPSAPVHVCHYGPQRGRFRRTSALARERVLGAICGCSMRISQSDNARCAAVVCCQRAKGTVCVPKFTREAHEVTSIKKTVGAVSLRLSSRRNGGV